MSVDQKSHPPSLRRCSPIARESLVYDVAGAAEALGVSQASIYAAVKARTLPSFRLGRRILIPRATLLALLDRQPNTGANPAA